MGACSVDALWCLHVLHFLDTTGRHKTKELMALVKWGREVWKKEVINNLPWKDERGSSSVRQTLEYFKGNAGETSKRWGGACMGFSKRIDTILCWTELNSFRVPCEGRQWRWRCSTGTGQRTLPLQTAGCPPCPAQVPTAASAVHLHQLHHQNPMSTGISGRCLSSCSWEGRTVWTAGT